jgi:hypothetical protein
MKAGGVVLLDDEPKPVRRLYFGRPVRLMGEFEIPFSFVSGELFFCHWNLDPPADETQRGSATKGCIRISRSSEKRRKSLEKRQGSEALTAIAARNGRKSVP